MREDYSAHGDAWHYFPHDHARSRAYRWNEDGLAGVCNRFQNTCLALGLWNEKDPILKERLFGLSGPEGNHGETVEEYYFHLDATPTCSYLEMAYAYPQVEFPYAPLVDEARRRSVDDREVALTDLIGGALAEDRWFDVRIAWAKADPDDLLCRITVTNRGPEAAPIHVLPHVWHRNTWSWKDDGPRPSLVATGDRTIRVHHPRLGERWWYVERSERLLFTENETNAERLFGVANRTKFVKDGINDAIVQGRFDRANPALFGTKAAAWFFARIPAGGSEVIRVRFRIEPSEAPFAHFDEIVEERRIDADEFHGTLHPPSLGADRRRIQRSAFAGLIWSQQFYHYNVRTWLDGDPRQPRPPESRKQGRNADWTHVYNNDVLSMPDKWEYPWFAAWDLAFHAVPIAMIDPELAKRQILLLLREWYMHPNGALPAYEYAFSDVNPPVHAWGAWQVYKIARAVTGEADTTFLERVFHKLLLNFTWWVNKKDRSGHNLFQGGFLGLDNIGVFDRSAELPTGGHLMQADGTAWMAMFCLNMLGIALELARSKPSYEDIATKFFEHFVFITNAIYGGGERGISLWNEEDGFFYDVLHTGEGQQVPLRVRSFVGLIPLLAVGGLHPKLLDALPHFRRRVEWFLEHRPELMAHVGSLEELTRAGHYQLAVVDRPKLERLLGRMFDEEEFLSPFGLRSLSRHHAEQPYRLTAGGRTYQVDYEPGESRTGMFGGNSNWRGPIWLPINYLMIQALRKYDLNYHDTLTVELPARSGQRVRLSHAADELTERLISIFELSGDRRPMFGEEPLFRTAPWRDRILFHEYFHGDSGRGLGASHQTGWTALVAKLLQGPDEIGMQ